MRVGDLSFQDLARQLSAPGVGIRTGPFTIRAQSSLKVVAECIGLLYADYLLANESEWIDFHVRIARPRSLRAWIRPQVIFFCDGDIPFKPLPLSQAFALYEWGLNWCIANNVHQYLIIHSAAIERGGRALIFPGPPGSGKSTLCAASVSRGWRLLSDELALVSVIDGTLTAIPRPISLKNDSIEIIRQFAHPAIFGPELVDTAKGRVAHMRPPSDSVQRADETAESAWIVFPKYVPKAPARLNPFPKARAFMSLAQNAFNYSLLGTRGFEVLSQVVDCCECFELTYSNLEQAVALFDAFESKADF